MEENNFIEDQNIFTLDGFNVTSNLSPSSDASRVYQYGDTYTLDSISSNSNSSLSLLKPKSQNIETLDLSNPRLYVKYSSLTELLRASLEYIISSYPSSLRISRLVVGYSYGDINAIDIQYNVVNNTTSFSLLTNYLDNPGNIAYIAEPDNANKYKNLNLNYSNYVFEYENQQFEIINFTPASKIKNDSIRITVEGKPFDDVLSKQISGYVTPTTSFISRYLSELSFFERYLLQDAFYILNILEENGGIEYQYRYKFSLPKKDKYNYDFESNRYEKILNNLLDLTSKYDEKYVNITSRKLIPQSFQDISITSGEFPTLGKANQLLNIYSIYFDEIYGNINALKYYDQVKLQDSNYDDKNRLFRLGSTLGFSFNNNELNSSLSSSEIMPFIKGIPYLLNSKGTRKSIFSALNYINIPNSLIEFNEKRYITKSIDYNALSYYYDVIGGVTLSNVPVTTGGLPDLSKIENNFHSSDYFNSLQNLLPDIEENFFLKINNNQNSEILVNIDFNLSGDTLAFSLYNLDWSNLACFSYSGGTVNNPLPETFFDGCDCTIDLDDLSMQVCTTPVNPYDTYCPPLVVDVVPNCIAIPQSGATLSGDTECVFNYKLYSEGGIENVLEPAIPIPVNYISFPYTLSLTSCNANDNNTFSLEQQVTPVHYYTNGTALMTSGGSISSIRLYDTISGTPEDINLDPTTTPYLSGCAGTITADDLLFPTGTTQTELDLWASNLEILIENAICSVYSGLPVAPTNNATYFMSVEVFTDGTFRIYFNNKNNPISPEYNIGINSADPYITFNNGTSNYISDSYILAFDNLNVVSSGDTICGTLNINKSISEADLLTFVDTNYDSISFNISEPVFSTNDNGSTQERTCLIGGNLTGDTFTYGAYLDINIYGGVPPYSLTGITQNQFFNSGDTFSFYVGDSGCNIIQVTGDVICNEDLCLGNQISTRTIQTTEIQEIEELVDCPAIEITHTMFLAGNGAEIGQYTTYDYFLTFNNFDQLSDPYYEIDIVAESNEFNFTGNTETFQETVAFTISSLNVSLVVYLRLYDGGCVYEQETEVFTLEYDLVEEDSSDDTLLAPSYIEIIEEEVTVNETIYEVTPNTPVLSASYECNENGTATLDINVSGGTMPYVYYGGADGEIVNDNETLSLYVKDANDCVSNTVDLIINCGAEIIECESINLEASLETTSLDNISETATLTFTYSITGLVFDESVQEVNLVASGVGATNNYILGSPVMKNFTGAFGAEQIYVDFTPDSLTGGTYKFIIVIKTENCTYTDIFEMSVDASILSDVDNYTNILE